jgi:serine protease Do
MEHRYSTIRDIDRQPSFRRFVMIAGVALLAVGAVMGAAQLVNASAPTASAANAAGSAGADAVRLTNMPRSFADLVAEVRPAVVNIGVTGPAPTGVRGEAAPGPQSPFRNRRPHQAPPGAKVRGVASGFLISADGLIVTNDHVIKGATKIMVTLNDGRQFEARVKGRDPKTDLALLSIDQKGLPHLAFGDSSKARIGDWVIAVGNPFGLGGSVSAGIISARGRDIQAGPYDDYLQVDAPINRGNSGGPLLDAAGRVIGVNTAIFSPTGGSVGIGFAIPAALAKQVIAELIEKGRVDRGWLGVAIQTVTPDIATALGLDEARGALVASVDPESPAAKAGIRVGDVILGTNGDKTKVIKDLTRAVAAQSAGSETPVTLWRNGKEMTVTVTIGSLPERQAAVATAPDQPRLGVAVATLTPPVRKRFGIADKATGIVVTDVRNDSAAARAGIRPGDVIVKADGRDVGAPEDLVAALKDATAGKRRTVLLLVERNGARRFVAANLGKAVG